MRLRLIGGRLRATSLAALLEVSERYGDGRIHLTSRANLQLRALPDGARFLPPQVLDALDGSGLVPSWSHELVRNIMVSPQTGLAGGRANLRPVAAAVDSALLAEEAFARLPGRFLFVLDDGRGDLVDRSCDLGLVALAADVGQLRVGDAWGDVLRLDEAAAAFARLALRFLEVRGPGPSAPWHVRELARPLTAGVAPRHHLPKPGRPLPYGQVPGGRHVEAPDGTLGRDTVQALLNTGAGEFVVTPWRGVLVPETA